MLVFGAGVQGTVYGVCLARAGHDVTLVARGARAIELRAHGAAIENVLTRQADVLTLPVIETIDTDIARAFGAGLRFPGSAAAHREQDEAAPRSVYRGASAQ
ncbi:MAG: ketopantoate reductase family protein [Vulcanimicrobiaceae bacterium]